MVVAALPVDPLGNSWPRKTITLTTIFLQKKVSGVWSAKATLDEETSASTSTATSSDVDDDDDDDDYDDNNLFDTTTSEGSKVRLTIC